MKYSLTAVTILFLATGCSHPLETKLSSVTPVKSNSFRIAPTIDNPSSAYIFARQNIIGRLEKKGFMPSDQGQIYLTITLSDRDANSSISISDGQEIETISDATDKAFFKFCRDKAVKLSIIMQDIKDGSTLYKGSATRRRCNINEEASIKYLAGAATSNLLPHQSN